MGHTSIFNVRLQNRNATCEAHAPELLQCSLVTECYVGINISEKHDQWLHGNCCLNVCMWQRCTFFFTLLVVLKSVFSNSATCSSSSLHVKRRESFGGIVINKMGMVKRKQKLFLKWNIHHTFGPVHIGRPTTCVTCLSWERLQKKTLLLLIGCLWYKSCGRWNSYTKSSNVVLKKQLNTRRPWHRAYSSLRYRVSHVGWCKIRFRAFSSTHHVKFKSKRHFPKHSHNLTGHKGQMWHEVHQIPRRYVQNSVQSGFMVTTLVDSL